MEKQNLLFFLLGAVLVACNPTQPEEETDFARYINPFVGTDLAGHTYPGALTPFGMLQVSPDTKCDSWDGCSGYHYGDSLIYGFTHTHLSGTGCVDYSDVLLMPFTGQTSVINTEYCSAFSHANEEASPGYYAVLLDKNRIRVELTAAKRLGIQKYTFPDNDEAKGVLLDLKHRDKVLMASIKYDKKTQTLTGIRNSSMWNGNQQLAYALVFSQPIERIVFFVDDQIIDPEVIGGRPDDFLISGTNVKALVYFSPDIQEVVAKTAISANTRPEDEAALKNLEQYDKQGFDFELFKEKARQEWNNELSKIKVETPDIEKKKIFYTSLYHAFTAPYLFTDTDGTYLGRDYKLHTVENGHEVYTVFSLWDTYRALHPLFNIIDRKRSADYLYTFMKQYEQGGALPIWELSAWETDCMIGYPAIPVIYDAFVKGIAGYDKQKMLKAMVYSAKTQWRGLPEYAQYGYIPADIENEGVSKVLEYAYDDWCIASYAKAIDDQLVYKEFNERCQFYKNILDPNGFVHAKINGAFIEPFNPEEMNSTLTEANSWQYSTYVPHDTETYLALLGGYDVAEQFFDSLFNTESETSEHRHEDIAGIIGQYAHGNEPSHHAAYWYNFVGKPWKTAEIVRRIMNDFYTCKPDGLCGNEDCGQMSAWYGFISFYG